MSPKYIQLLFNSPKGRKDIEELSAGGVQKNLTGSNLLKMELAIPSLPEQQKIAATLSSLDALITVQRETLDALKLHKKGLMQGLFPT